MRHNDEAGLHAVGTGQDEDPGRERRMGFRLWVHFLLEGRGRCRVMDGNGLGPYNWDDGCHWEIGGVSAGRCVHT